MATTSLTEALQETLVRFDSGGAPKTTREVADSLDLGRRSTYERLDRLVERGRLETKKVGGNGRVWWQPRDDTSPESPDSAGGSEALGDAPDGAAFGMVERVVDAVEGMAFLTLDTDGDVQSWSAGAEQLTGYGAGEIQGEHVSTVYTDEDRRAGVPAEHLAAAAASGSITDEGWRVRADGSLFRASVTIVAIHEGDTLERFAVLVHDTKEPSEYEQEPGRRRDYTRQILETAPVGVLTVEPDGTFTTANQQAVRLLSLDDGKNTVGIREVYDEDGAFVPPEERPYLEAFETGESVRNWHAMVEREDGSRRWLSTNVEPMTGEDGEIEEVLVTIEEITQLKEQARRLARQRDDLESELESVMERVAAAFYALDDEWRFTFVNERAAELLQHPRDELLGHRLWDVFPEADGAMIEEQFREAMRTLEPVSFEMYAGPLESWLEVDAYPSEDGLSVYFHEITDRKERERRLETSERRYRTLVENFPDGSVGLFDETFRYTTVGGELMDRLGIDAADRTGRRIPEIHSDGMVDQIEPQLRAVFEGESNSFEVEYRDHHLQIRTLPVRDGDGEVYAGMFVVRDVTEREKRQRELERALDLLSRTERTADVGGWEVDTETMDVFWSDHLFDLLDVPYDEEPPLDEALDVYHEEDRPVVEAAVERALETGEPFEVEARFLTQAGEVRWLDVRGVPETEDGEVVTLRGAAQDITDRKERERELKRQREQLAAVNYVNEIVRDITEAVIEQSTREEIESIVCERLARADSYEFAWIGDVAAGSETVQVRTEAGTEGYMDDVTISVDPDDERSLGPTGRAFRTGEIQTTRDVTDDSRHDHGQDDSFRSSAAIPLVHDDTVYGVLNVYADRLEAFDGQERAVISQLGEIVGHAIAAAERKRALMGDEVVELQFRHREFFEEFGVTEPPSGRITLDHAVPIDDGEFVVYGSATGEAADSVPDLVEAIPHWAGVTFQDDDWDGETKFQLRYSDPPVLSRIAALGGSAEQAVVEDGEFRMTLHLAPNVDVRSVIDRAQTALPGAEMVKRRQISRSDTGRELDRTTLLADLTPRQRATLEAAVYAGYFEWPRDASGEDVADSLDIAPTTFSQHLRKAEKSIFERLFPPRS